MRKIKSVITISSFLALGFFIGDALAITRANRIIVKLNKDKKALTKDLNNLRGTFHLVQNLHVDAINQLVNGEDPEDVIGTVKDKIQFYSVVQPDRW